MTFQPDELLATMSSLERDAGPASRLIVAYSGGIDSTALLGALAETAQEHGKPVLAVHVNHQLDQNAADWSDHCRRVADALGVAFESEKVVVAGGRGPEASARDARYGALERYVADGDWLLTAHHRDDQAETLLYRLLRGSGPAGIAAIAPIRRFGRGWLARPLLGIDRSALADYVDRSGLRWVDDPSNAESRFDRNFLRNDVIPLLESRWPGVAGRLGRSALYARETHALAAEIADEDIERAGGDPARLPIAAFIDRSVPRQKNLVRRAVDRLGLPTPPATALSDVLGSLLTARADAAPLVAWTGAEARRYRDVLYLMPAMAPPEFSGMRLGRSPVSLGPGLGTLRLVETDGRGLPHVAGSGELTLHSRKGGEQIRISSQSHTKKLKKLLQEEGIVPWMRGRLPLVYRGPTLVAVADLWLADGHDTEGGFAVHWADRPSLR